MTLKQISPPFKIFSGTDGNALENGNIYIGKPNLNPEVNPVSVYWDSDLTIPAAQPIKTINGYPSRNGAIAKIYTKANYSITVRDKNNVLVYSDFMVENLDDSIFDALNYGSGEFNSETINAAITAISGEKACLLIRRGDWDINTNVLVPANIELCVEAGADIQVQTGITFTIDGPMDAPIQCIFTLNGTGLVLFGKGFIEKVYPQWWGAIGDASNDDSAAIQNAINSFGSDHGIIHFIKGDYYCDNAIDIKECRFKGDGVAKDSPLISRLYFTGTNGISSSIESNHGFYIEDLEVWGSATKTANGQVLIDFTGQNYPHLKNVRIWQAGIGVQVGKGTTVECNYGNFDRVDINQCDIGFKVIQNTPAGSNSHSFYSGRLWDSNIGIDIPFAHTNISFFGTSFESNDTYGIQSEGTNISFFGCRFENGNINVKLLSNAGAHFFFGNHWSSGSDIDDDTVNGAAYVFDNADNSTTQAEGYKGKNIVSVPNMLLNPYFEHDTNSNGVPDDWGFFWSSLGTGVMTLDPTESSIGTNAVKIVSGTGNNLRLQQDLDVVEGAQYTLSIRSKIDTGSARIRLGNSGSASTEYLNTEFSHSNYRINTFTFTATSNVLNVTIYLNGTVDRTVLIDYMTLVQGLVPNYNPIPHSPDAINGGGFYHDVEWYGSSFGPVINSPNGTRYRIEVSDGGALSTNVVTSIFG